MNHNKQILLIFISVLLLNGCAVYYPQTTDIPLIKEKKELRVDGGISLFYINGGTTILPSINGTVSYGLTDKIAVQITGNTTAGSAYYSQGLSQYLIAGAIGLYKYNPTNNWTKELYVGIGNGFSTFHDYDNYHSGSLLGNYQVYYVQGNIGRRGIKHKFLEYAFGLKLGLINTHFYVEDVYSYTSNTTGQKYNELGAFIEPVISIKLGGERLMLNIKPSFCYMRTIIKTNNNVAGQYGINKDYEYPYSPYGIGLSLNYRFSK